MAQISGGNVYFGSGNGFLYALEGNNGEEIWRFKTGGPVRSTPAVVAGVVYFGAMTAFYMHWMRPRGQEVWSFKTGGGESSPLVSEDAAYFESFDRYLYGFP